MICPICGSDRERFTFLNGRVVCTQCGNYAETLEKARTGGIRHDQDKLNWSLVPMEHLEGMVRVLMFGAKKYDAHNWRKGLTYSRITNSLQRHLNAFNAGETLDPESNLPHTAHILCNALFLAGMEAEHPQLDDRYTTIRRHADTPTNGAPAAAPRTDGADGVLDAVSAAVAAAAAAEAQTRGASKDHDHDGPLERADVPA